ncbi:hypothetical protein LPJ66_005908 [Kickxella alabastrina]|uniref:Uncharacterized protein n=1 Tax=Kickxella alabastrina TaxID=61397 RepID=A0ACC1ID87_9FUNG|nr:hypothetical protein LPJ66_005908 [Kickxella alabastrina]
MSAAFVAPRRQSSSSQRPDQSTATQQQQTRQDGMSDRCWICLDDLNTNQREWLYPCKCSLICHEECLLHWVSESEKRTRTGTVKCPQCNTPYKVVQWKSTTFNILRTIYDVIDKSMPFFLATIGSMAVVVACTAYGAYTVMTVYGPTEGKLILSGSGKWDHTRWIWLPMIPMALIWSRFQASAAYMPLSTLLMTAPQPLRLQWPMPPSLTLTALPTIGALYRYLWDITLGRLERRWEGQTSSDQQLLTIRRFGLRHGVDANPNNANFNQLAAEHAAEQQQIQQQQQGVRQPRAGRNFEATIVLNSASLGRTLVESLLLPLISSACGALINKLPFMIRPIGLSHFSKVMLGGCAYFLVKDLVRMLYKYLLYRSRSSRYIQGRKRP